jgi:hypothetical protein
MTDTEDDSDVDSMFGDDDEELRSIIGLPSKKIPETSVHRKERLDRLQTSKLKNVIKMTKEDMISYGYVYISGPSRLITIKGSETIQLFGENHDSGDSCEDLDFNEKKKSITLSNFFYNYFKCNDNTLIDFYLEMPSPTFLSSKKLKEQSELYKWKVNMDDKKTANLIKLRASLINCFYMDELNCTHKNVRFHAIDPRLDDIFKFYQMATEIQSGMFTMDLNKFRDKYAKEIVELTELTKMNCKKYSEYLIKKIIVKLRQKIYMGESTPDKYSDNKGVSTLLKRIQTAVQRLCSGELNKQSDMLRNNKYFYDIIIGKIDAKTMLSYRKSADILYQILDSQESIFLDIWTVVNMLLPIGGKVQKNIIFYGGDAHTLNIERLLNILEYKTTKHKTTSNGCLKINIECKRI